MTNFFFKYYLFMMKDNILTICLGNDSKNLCGAKNDSILFYNYIYLLYTNKNLKQNWYKPKLFFNNDVVEDNIKKYLKEFKFGFNKILLFYSGNGINNGQINIKNKYSNYMKDTYLLNLINVCLKKDIELYIILDCCYSGSFEIVPFDKIKKINIMTSCDKNQLSNEGITSYKNLLKNNRINKFTNCILKKNDSIILGIFTYNLLEFLYKINFDDITNWKNIFKFKNYWEHILKTANQKPIFIWN